MLVVVLQLVDLSRVLEDMEDVVLAEEGVYYLLTTVFLINYVDEGAGGLMATRGVSFEVSESSPYPFGSVLYRLQDAPLAVLELRVVAVDQGLVEGEVLGNYLAYL